MKKTTIIFIVLAVLMLLWFLTVDSQAATYYVDADADAGGDGTTSATTGANCAWDTIADVNGTDFANGDIVQLQRGDSWSETLTLLSSTTAGGGSVNGLTIQPYGEGARPKLNGDVARPVNIVCTSTEIQNLTITSIDISGQDWQNTKSNNLYINECSGITLDDIYGNGHENYGGGASEGMNGIVLNFPSGTVEIKNCTLFNWGLLSWTAVKDYHAIFIKGHNGTALIHDNTIYNAEGDLMQFEACWHTGGGVDIYDNDLYDWGENAIDIKQSDEVDIYRNEIYYTGAVTAADSGRNSAIVIHTNSNLGPSDNIVVRENYFHDIGHSGWEIGGGIYIAATSGDTYDVSNVSIYHNWFEDNEGMIYLYASAGADLTNINIHNNLVTGVWATAPTQTIPVKVFTGATSTINFYNNTFYSNAAMGEQDSVSEAAIWFENPSDTIIFRNNIVYINDTNTLALKVESADNPTISSNQWYNADAGDDTIIEYQGTSYTESSADEATWQGGTGDANSIFAAPSFNSPASEEFWLTVRSAGDDTICNNAIYKNGLESATTWNPIAIYTLDRSIVGCDKGAYAWGTSPTLYPVQGAALGGGEYQ